MNVPAESKVCSSCKCEKPLSDFYKDRYRKDGLQTKCKDCCKASVKEWREANPEKARLKEQNRVWTPEQRATAVKRADAWNKANPEKKRAQVKAWAQRNKDRVNAKSRAWRKQNHDKMLDILASWRDRNPVSLRLHRVARRSRELKAFPEWANKEAIRQFYEIARKLTVGTGESWHVDHIVPLKNDLVCGLHVHNNLRVIRATDNLRKHNQFDPDIPD